MDPVDRGEIDLPTLLAGGAHRRNLQRDIALDDAIGMGKPVIGAFAGRDMNQLLRRGDDGRLGLPCRISGQGMQDDEAHFIVHALKPSELVEYAVAPKKIVSGGRQFIAIGAQFQSLLPGAVIPR